MSSVWYKRLVDINFDDNYANASLSTESNLYLKNDKKWFFIITIN